MEHIIAILDETINSNKIELNNLSDLTQDLRDYLTNKAIICYIDCKDIKIMISTQINKIILVNCENINLNINGLVGGLEITKSENINIECNSKPINNVSIDRSMYININIYNIFKKHTYCEVEKSKYVILS